MRRSRGLQKLIATLVAISFCYVSVVVAPVQAAMIGTSDVLQIQDSQNARQKVRTFLERQDVGRYLEAMGVDAQEAKARVDHMTDEEVNMVVSQIDDLPAGGDALGFLLGVAVFLFILLLILDLVGVTDVFTFIKKR